LAKYKKEFAKSFFCITFIGMEDEEKKIIEGIKAVPKAVDQEILKDTGIVAKEIAKDGKFVIDEIEKTPQLIADGVKFLNRPAKFSFKIFLKKLGPGIITGASDDDSSGVGTYSSVGAKYQYQQIWLALYLLPLMTAVQEICARIGLVTDEGLAGTVRRHFSKKSLIFVATLLLIANTINIAADLGAMAASTQMLISEGSIFHNFYFLLIAFTLTVVLLEIFIPYKNYAKILKFLVLSLLAYVVTAFYSHPDWWEILKQTIVPKVIINKDYIMSMVAVMGTTISPYLFFWQTSEEIEEHIKKHLDKDRSKKVELAELADMREDVFAGMGLANIIFFFIVITTATVLFPNGITNIESPQQAAEALRPLAGNFSYILFTVGIIGTGLLGVPVLAGSSAYAIAETMNWNEGLYRKFKNAKGFYGIIAASTIVGLLLNFFGVNPIKALVGAAVVNGIVAPILLFFIMRISNDKKIMGPFTNGKLTNFFGWTATGLMGIAAILMIVLMIF